MKETILDIAAPVAFLFCMWSIAGMWACWYTGAENEHWWCPACLLCRRLPRMLNRLKDNRGQAIAEAAILLPVFVLVAFGLVDLQWMLKDAADVDYIVTESARCEAQQLPACTAPSSASSYAQTMAASLRLSATGLTIDAPPCTTICTVTIAYKYQAIGAWFPAFTIHRTGMSAFVPAPPPS